jgi:dihydrodipicolinate synthase/N-acetylneuraminate lyase
MTLPRPLKGIITPMLTPLSDPDALDAAALERLIEHLIRGGVSGIFILGSTGEAPGLSYRLRREVIDRACSIVHGRLPILVGINDTSSVESLALAEHSAGAGASALVLSPPYYYSLSQSLFLGYLERFVPKLPLPLYLYNMPTYTKLSIAPETVRAAAELPNLYGLKDSSGDRAYFSAVQKAVAGKPEFALLGGVEEVLADFVSLGAHGGVCGGSNLEPELYVRICNAAARGDRLTVEALQERIMRISSGVYRVGEPGSSYLRGLKCAASLLGLCSTVMAEPYVPLNPAEQERIRENLLEIGLLPR